MEYSWVYHSVSPLLRYFQKLWLMKVAMVYNGSTARAKARQRVASYQDKTVLPSHSKKFVNEQRKANSLRRFLSLNMIPLNWVYVECKHWISMSTLQNKSDFYVGSDHKMSAIHRSPSLEFNHVLGLNVFIPLEVHIILYFTFSLVKSSPSLKSK